MSAPNWEDHIRYLFTPFDRVRMAAWFDLGSYDDVRKYHEKILLAVTPDPNTPGMSKLPRVSLMPLYEEPWTDEMRSQLAAWKDAGFPRGAPAPEPPPPFPCLDEFIDLSETLTGFDDLGRWRNLALVYANQLKDVVGGDALAALLDAWRSIRPQATALEMAISQQIFGDAALSVLAKQVITLWYTGQIDANHPAAPDRHYIYGLVWPAAGSHPMGYATENVFGYWQQAPSPKQGSGLDPGTPPDLQLPEATHG